MIETLKKPVLTDNLIEDIQLYLGDDYQHVFVHSMEVAVCARELALRFGEDEQAAEIAGLLHDISVVIPNEKKLELCERVGIDICEAEQQVPMLSHQKLSRYMAEELFEIQDKQVLSAIECHTTLKEEAGKFDHIVFIADKIKWDQGGEPPYLAELQSALDASLEAASLLYINYLLTHDILVVHPWLKAAQEDLTGQLN